MRRTVLRCAAPSLLLVALVLVPFADKAFTIDDPVFLEEARHALTDPLHPSAFETVWGHAVRVPASSITTSGPVMAWLLIPAVTAQRSERAAHLIQLAFLALAVVATVSLALRLGLASGWASIAGLLVAANPTALAMAGTAMPDVPAMALGVAGLERLVAWREQRGIHRAISAALLLALATLARAHLAALVGVGALFIAGEDLANPRWHRERWSIWIPLAAVPVLVAMVLLVTRDPGSAAPEVVGAIAAWSAAGYAPRNLISFGVHWVLAVPLAIPWALLRRLALMRRWPVFLIACAAAVVLTLRSDGPPTWEIVPVAALGITVLADVLADAWERRDLLQLALGLWLLAPLPAALYMHLPPKYLLAAAPAIALLVAREGARRAPRGARTVVMVAAVGGVALGVAILRADTAFAAVGRRAATELVAPYVASGERVWFTPQWGFLWYATRAGGIPATADPPHPSQGDLLVTSQNTWQSPELQKMLAVRYGRRARHLARVEDRRAGGRTMDAARGVGFFSNVWGHLPWTWSSSTIDAFDLWRLE